MKSSKYINIPSSCFFNLAHLDLEPTFVFLAHVQKDIDECGKFNDFTMSRRPYWILQNVKGPTFAHPVKMFVLDLYKRMSMERKSLHNISTSSVI